VPTLKKINSLEIYLLNATCLSSGRWMVSDSIPLSSRNTEKSPNLLNEKIKSQIHKNISINLIQRLLAKGVLGSNNSHRNPVTQQIIK